MKEQNLTGFFNILFLNHIPFGAFSWPGSKSIKFIIQNTSEINELSKSTYIDDLNGFIIHPFDNSKHRIYFINNDFEIDESKINIETIKHFENIKFGINPFQNETEYIITKEEYLKQVEFIKQALRIHKIKKMVLSRLHSIYFKNKEMLPGLFLKLIDKYPEAFVYFFNIPGRECWLGASPEKLICKQNSTYTIDSIAGTQIFTDKDINDYIWNSKNILEHSLVSKYIQEILNKFMVMNVVCGKAENYRAGNLIHLKTTFQFESNSDIITKITDLLHPTPAVCGYPKEASLKLIQEIENHDRRYYTGFLGTVNQKQNTGLFVNIRCARFSENQLTLYAGGGILPDSEPETEWNETNAKFSTILNISQNL